MVEYERQAIDFLEKANATCNIAFMGFFKNKEWEDKETRPLYKVTLATPRGSMEFEFWDSIRHREMMAATLDDISCKKYGRFYAGLSSYEQRKVREAKAEIRKENTASVYDILACLTTQNPGTFYGFCNNYGYDEDSRKAERIYHAVCDEYRQLARIFTREQLDEISEIQ